MSLKNVVDKLLGINIDSTLTNEDHLNKICKKASQKLKTPDRNLNTWMALTGPSFHNFFSAVSTVIKRPLFSENDHFKLKIYILTSICQTFLSNIYLKLPLLDVQNSVSFSWRFSLKFFNCPGNFIEAKKREKLHNIWH